MTLTDSAAALEVPVDDVLALDEAMGRLAALNGRQERVLELRFCGGMSEEEIAGLLGVTTRKVERDWVRVRLFLHRELYPGAGSR